MIVIASVPGQLGNRLIVHASVMAWCIRHNKRLINPSLAPYDRYFTLDDTHRVMAGSAVWSDYRRAYTMARIAWRSGNRIPGFHCQWIDWHEEVDLDRLNAGSPLFSRRTIFLQGWRFRANASLATAKEAIRRHFSLAAGLRDRLDAYWRDHEPSTFRVGVHIRRGDYRGYEGGRYFYDDETYRACMTACARMHPDRKIRFVICSNERVDLDFFRSAGLDAVPGPGHEALDMYALSECHLLMGPPSTYSTWASFLRDVPLFAMTDKQVPFSRDEAGIVTAF